MIKYSNTTTLDASLELATKISTYLNDSKKVLWLICGGSNIPIAIQALNELKRRMNDNTTMENVSVRPTNSGANDTVNPLLHNLTVTLTDERYGSINHPDSNWRQLREQGFDFALVNAIPVLVGKSLDETTKLFGINLRDALNQNDVIVGQFGIGTDGHIAGVLPNSIGVKSPGTVVSYDAGKFKRITITLKTISSMNIAYSFVYGESKREAISNLRMNLTVDEQPAQILKEVGEAVIFTDQ